MLNASMSVLNATVSVVAFECDLVSMTVSWVVHTLD